MRLSQELRVIVALPMLKLLMWLLKKHFRITPTEYRKQVKNIGRKTTLQDWKEIISVENQDVLNLLHSFLSYEDDSRAKDELEFMSKKLEYLKEKLADVVKGL